MLVFLVLLIEVLGGTPRHGCSTGGRIQGGGFNKDLYVGVRILGVLQHEFVCDGLDLVCVDRQVEVSLPKQLLVFLAVQGKDGLLLEETLSTGIVLENSFHLELLVKEGVRAVLVDVLGFSVDVFASTLPFDVDLGRLSDLAIGGLDVQVDGYFSVLDEACSAVHYYIYLLYLDRILS